MNATFMSKPFADGAGSGCHAHVSLTGLDSGENVFGDDSDPQGMSDLCRRFMAGQLRHARGIYAVLAPTVNCLKRRRPHTFSPTNISWGPEDRTAFLRIKSGSTASRHIENRAPTGLSNPYLVGAAMLAAGLNGIEEELELEPAAYGAGRGGRLEGAAPHIGARGRSTASRPTRSSSTRSARTS